MPKKQISHQWRKKETNCYPCKVSSPSLILFPLHSIPPSAGQPYHCLSFLLFLYVSQGSACVPPRCLLKTFIRETALLIKELIFSLLSLISIVNLKHCEFFKFSSLLSKKERKKKRWEWGIFNRLSRLPEELYFSLFLLFFSSQQCKEILLKAGQLSNSDFKA